MSVPGLLAPNAWGLAMTTLAIVVSSVILCVLIGLPLGILTGKNDRFEQFMRPFLDTMQTIPAFVYLVPVVMLIGIGNVSGVIVTIVFALATPTILAGLNQTIMLSLSMEVIASMIVVKGLGNAGFARHGPS